MFRAISLYLASKMTRFFIAAAIAAVFAGIGQAAVPAGSNGFSLVWSDDFTGGANTAPSSSNWKYDTGQGVFGTGEIETMTNSLQNVFVDGNGNLQIVARGSGSSWTSGRIETVRDDFAAPAGGILAVQGSMQLPSATGAAAAGYWPAFWMLGSTMRTGTTWPLCGEIDIMESINGINEVFGTLHCGTAPGMNLTLACLYQCENTWSNIIILKVVTATKIPAWVETSKTSPPPCNQLSIPIVLSLILVSIRSVGISMVRNTGRCLLLQCLQQLGLLLPTMDSLSFLTSLWEVVSLMLSEVARPAQLFPAHPSLSTTLLFIPRLEAQVVEALAVVVALAELDSKLAVLLAITLVSTLALEHHFALQETRSAVSYTEFIAQHSQSIF